VVESDQEYRSQGDKYFKHDDSLAFVPWPQHQSRAARLTLDGSLSVLNRPYVPWVLVDPLQRRTVKRPAPGGGLDSPLCLAAGLLVHGRLGYRGIHGRKKSL
jgi:hypothetical protein